jgi:hypothetical protein
MLEGCLTATAVEWGMLEGCSTATAVVLGTLEGRGPRNLNARHGSITKKPHPTKHHKSRVQYWGIEKVTDFVIVAKCCEERLVCKHQAPNTKHKTPTSSTPQPSAQPED